MRVSACFLIFFSVCLFAGEKIASLSPNLTEIICLLGGRSSLCGRSSACDYPADVRTVPVVGSFGKANPEALVASGATLVVTASERSPNDRAILERAGIRCLKIPANSIADYYSALRTLGKILDRSDAAETEIKRIQAEFAAFRKTRKPVPKVLVMISETPIYTAGRRTFIHELIELAGGENIAGTEDREYFIVSPEWVLQRNPDILISCGKPLNKNSVLSAVKAFRTGKILTELDPSLLYRLGPRSIEAVRKLHEYFQSSR